jgi:hypothetical protein
MSGPPLTLKKSHIECEAVHNFGARDWHKSPADCSPTQRPDLKPEQWKRTKRRNQVYDIVTEEFSRDVMAPPATVLSHICITDVAKPKAIEAFGNVYDETRDKLSQRNQ